jgi:single-stranded-DNA-specific exonuclease
VDGLCAAAILWEALYFGRGYKNVYPFIPDRFTDGYGLSAGSLEKINRQYSTVTMKPLLVTVDCGITAREEIALAKSWGWSVLVVDHHRPEKVLPEADAILWTDQLCAAGLAWFLSFQLDPSSASKQLELAALATVADLQPLLGGNRSLVKFGLSQLAQTKRLGLKALIEAGGFLERKLDTWAVGWILAPRLNAAGRLEDAYTALRLLCTRDRKQAENLAEELSILNRSRQRKTMEVFAHAKMSYQAVQQSSSQEKRIILVGHETYHEGVIGLVAGKLVQEFCRPAIVLSHGEKSAKGSARSIPGFDILAALREAEHLFEDLGGHAQAAGFTIANDKVPTLAETLERLGAKLLADELLSPSLQIDAEIPFETVGEELGEKLKNLEPYGVGNPEPVFLSRGVGVRESRVVGQEGQHLKLRLKRGAQEVTALWFGWRRFASSLPAGAEVDAVYTVGTDRWNGREEIILKIKDLRIVS